MAWIATSECSSSIWTKRSLRIYWFAHKVSIEEDYIDLVDSFEKVEMTRAIGGSDLKAIKDVRTLIKKYNPDIVYAHSSKAGAIARVADIGLKNHCVYNPHGGQF